MIADCPKIRDISRREQTIPKGRIGKIEENQNPTIYFINPYTLPYNKLNEIVDQPTRSLHSLQRSNSNMSTKTNQPNTKDSQGTQTRLSLLAFLLHKGHKLLLLKHGVAVAASEVTYLAWG